MNLVSFNVSGANSLKPQSRRKSETQVLQQTQHQSRAASGRINAQCHTQLTQLQAGLLLSHAQFVMGKAWLTCCNFSTIKHQSSRQGKFQEATGWGKSSLPRGRNVQDGLTASCGKKELGKNSQYTSFALSKVTNLGLICLLSFYGTEISGSQEVIEIGEVTTVVVGEAKEKIFPTFRFAST